MSKLTEKQKSIITLALFALPLINAILNSFGISPLPLGEQEVETLLSLIITAIGGLIAWWKNNNMSQKAILKKEATENKTEEELKELAGK